MLPQKGDFLLFDVLVLKGVVEVNEGVNYGYDIKSLKKPGDVIKSGSEIINIISWEGLKNENLKIIRRKDVLLTNKKHSRRNSYDNSHSSCSINENKLVTKTNDDVHEHDHNCNDCHNKFMSTINIHFIIYIIPNLIVIKHS